MPWAVQTIAGIIRVDPSELGEYESKYCAQN
jgi:hypothetical protein